MSPNVPNRQNTPSLKKAFHKTGRRYAHLVIDVQKEFCAAGSSWGTPRTENVAQRIAYITPDIQSAGAYTVFVCYPSTDSDEETSSDADLHLIDHIKPDITYIKDTDSAFRSGHGLANTLRKEKITSLILSGFNITACVGLTAIDAIKEGFEVYVLRDCVANGAAWGNLYDMVIKGEDQSIEVMKKYGIKVIDADFALQLLRYENAMKEAPQTPSPSQKPGL